MMAEFMVVAVFMIGGRVHGWRQCAGLGVVTRGVMLGRTPVAGVEASIRAINKMPLVVIYLADEHHELRHNSEG
jgi:hypothetical protein